MSEIPKKYSIDNAKNDIQNLQDQNSYDLQEIKRLDRLIKDYDKRVLQATNMNNLINKKIQDDYEKIKKVIIDENVSAALDKKIDEIQYAINELFSLIKNNGNGLGYEYEVSCTSEYILDKMYPMGQEHEAIPSGLITDTWKYNSKWENQNRPTAIAHTCNQSGCPGTGLFKALGCWSNVYRVEGTPFSQNTGVEMKDIKVYGWYNGVWELVQHLPVPNGNFYAESFGGDASKYFADSVKQTSTSKTIILREKNKIEAMNWSTGKPQTENCMYHPFSDIKYFDTKYEYLYTCIDLRKVKWNENGIDDRDSSHYCSNCGGDWWLVEGLTFHDSWQHNKGVCQPKMIEITNEWRRFSMTTVPEGWSNGFPK